MAKTTIKTYFTGVIDTTDYNKIIRVNGSAEQCQGYVPNIVTLKYSGLSIPAEKKIIKHTINGIIFILKLFMMNIQMYFLQ